ncbi:hypothetical protein CgIS1_01315 [Frankia sp. CgS1]|nr:hypothetical protein Manayef4_06065 [Frankia sp. CgIM4]OHV57793.1 hypothetical protein CgIS1_01315 [Frankia sp. CgIS1]
MAAAAVVMVAPRPRAAPTCWEELSNAAGDMASSSVRNDVQRISVVRRVAGISLLTCDVERQLTARSLYR